MRVGRTHSQHGGADLPGFSLGNAHIAKKTRALVESLKGKLQLLYSPPYAPEFSRRSG
jgi:hypothetical protein